MRKGTAAFLVLACLAALASAQLANAAASAWVLFDDFNSGIIDPSKWTALEEGNGVGRETQRLATGGRLTMQERCYGYLGSNTGVPYEQQKLYFTNPATIKAMKATVKPLKFEAVGCPDNQASTWAAARIAGYFFNTGSTAPADGVNDVQALIGIFHDSLINDGEDNATVKAMVRQCTDASCNNVSLIHEEILGSIKKGQQAILSLEWNQTGHKFIFSFNRKTYIYKYDVAAYPDKYSSYYKGKRLEVTAQVANCILGQNTPRPTGLMHATFDDVYVKTVSP